MAEEASRREVKETMMSAYNFWGGEGGGGGASCRSEQIALTFTIIVFKSKASDVKDRTARAVKNDRREVKDRRSRYWKSNESGRAQAFFASRVLLSRTLL